MLKWLGRVLKGIWRIIDGVRSGLVNLVFLLVLAVVLALLLRPAPGVPDGAALVLRPVGELVEQVTLDDPLGLIRSGGVPVAQTAQRDLLEAIDAARADERIHALVIETDNLARAGLARLGELHESIAAFRATGKPVYARGERFTQTQYLLAAAADEVHVAPDGFVLLPGLARYASYFGDALESMGVKVHVFRVGEYKSFSEPFTRTGMSDEDREATQDLLDGLWEGMRERVIARRGIEPATLEAYVSRFDERLEASAGDAARAAREAGLVDKLSWRDEWRAMLRERVGAGDNGDDFRAIELDDYLAVVRDARPHRDKRVAVLVAQGSIMDGRTDSESVGGDSLAERIRELREDDSVRALVLRIDSPGGSAWASEVIRRELELTRKAGKPVVASMSTVAASGGYWVAAGADEIWARPETLTGSIGVFAMFPELAEPLQRLGVTHDGVATGPLAGALDPRRPLAPEAARAMQLGVEHSYRRFLDLVATARKLPLHEVDTLARGRVWTGEAAHKLGLVDQLGGLHEAVAAAGRRAGLQEYEVVWDRPEHSPVRLLLRRLFTAEAPRAGALQQVLVRLEADAAALLSWNDPRHLYLHCLCEAP